MVCPACDVNDPECPHCPDCEKHPADIHTTPPNHYINVGSGFVIDPRPPRPMIETRLAQLEADVRALKDKAGI